MNSGTPSSPGPADEPLSLKHAMSMADVVRQHFKEKGVMDQAIKSPVPPGALEGLAGLVVTGVALIPARRALLSQWNHHPAFRNFVDLVISVGHALLATQVGLITGSVYGSQTFLNAFSKIPSTAESSTADSICRDAWKDIIPLGVQTGLTAPTEREDVWWNPRVQAMRSLDKAILQCRNRLDIQSGEAQQFKDFTN
eukprot:Nitzschia sp. Nitz4//scaffold7_size249615//108645//109235//NITZ4_001171-RA/size249615-processed-gene-0.141-mRNA-1//1//CDS//3329558424//9472//frame0